jgi:hypothetical protein
MANRLKLSLDIGGMCGTSVCGHNGYCRRGDVTQANMARIRGIILVIRKFGVLNRWLPEFVREEHHLRMLSTRTRVMVRRSLGLPLTGTPLGAHSHFLFGAPSGKETKPAPRAGGLSPKRVDLTVASSDRPSPQRSGW